jgi:dimethylhistidine N-methyltransferase
MMQSKERDNPPSLLRRGIGRLYGRGWGHRKAVHPEHPARRMTDARQYPGCGQGQLSHAELGELVAGLTAEQASISSKYFYDALGSRLFEAITHLPEYYPTRTEAAIFDAHRDDIARAAGAGSTMIDLGAGNCEKARSLFGALRPARYVAVDISADYLQQSLACLRHQFPAIDLTGIGMDMSAGVQLPPSVPSQRRLFFFPGSSIGNFTPAQALDFLSGLRAQCDDDGGLLIGVDLLKDKAVMDAAYDDSLGVTAAFNLNALTHVNALLGSNFDVRDWRHCGFFNPDLSRVEMHVETRLAVDVCWPGGSRHFEAGERIHTENSYKYRLEDFSALLQGAGFGRVTSWTDRRNWFAVCHAAAGRRPVAQ